MITKTILKYQHSLPTEPSRSLLKYFFWYKCQGFSFLVVQIYVLLSQFYLYECQVHNNKPFVQLLFSYRLLYMQCVPFHNTVFYSTFQWSDVWYYNPYNFIVSFNGFWIDALGGRYWSLSKLTHTHIQMLPVYNTVQNRRPVNTVMHFSVP
jgi:hypothetical protein